MRCPTYPSSCHCPYLASKNINKIISITHNHFHLSENILKSMDKPITKTPKPFLSFYLRRLYTTANQETFTFTLLTSSLWHRWVMISCSAGREVIFQQTPKPDTVCAYAILVYFVWNLEEIQHFDMVVMIALSPAALTLDWHSIFLNHIIVRFPVTLKSPEILKKFSMPNDAMALWITCH